MKPFFYIANWKMAMNRQSVQTFMAEFHTDTTLYNRPDTTMILCPSFTHIAIVASLLNGTNAKLGGQTCSTCARGSYTGQISAAMLAETGCSYCIIGHSERRILLKETSEDVSAQYRQLVTNDLTPIICIGETAEERATKKTLNVLEQQLAPIVRASKDTPAECLLIAYEPVWAIGSGHTPTLQDLAAIFAWLKNFIATHLTTSDIFLLYGGSVDEINASEIKKINSVNGFLIGNASLDFQKFKNIVL
jgi:triosephosphate isomerase